MMMLKVDTNLYPRSTSSNPMFHFANWSWMRNTHHITHTHLCVHTRMQTYTNLWLNYYLCVPACTFHEKPVYVGPITRGNAEVLPILLGDITLQTHAVQRPLVSMMWRHKDVLSSIKCYPISISTINAVGCYLRAVVCMMAVRKDCGLKKPANHTVEGNRKSDDQASSSLILASRSINHKVRPDMDG